MHHQHLACGAAARADADGVAGGEGLREAAREFGRDHLQHQHRGTGLLQLEGLSAQGGGGHVVAALHAVAAEGVYGLRCESQMRAHRNAAFHQELHRRRGPAAALEFDHVCARLHEAAGAAQGLLLALGVAAVGQIAHQPGRALCAVQTAGHAFRVIGHGVEADAHRAVQTLADHAERVAHQNALHARRIGHRRVGRVVGGEHGDLLARCAHLSEARQAHRFALRHRGRGRNRSVRRSAGCVRCVGIGGGC